MAFQYIFKRYELKYLLTRAQKAKILEAMAPFMALDEFGHTTIRNIYYDTTSYRLIRTSIEKPAYKEKLRVRSYKTAGENDTVFIELKKKHDSIVYKRRISMSRQDATMWLDAGKRPPKETQITREIDYFLDYYETLYPAVFLSYEREAYYMLNGEDFRVTFDNNVRFRQENVSLGAEVWGTPILDDDQVLMEIKCSGGIPLWMVNILSQEKIYKTSFSKYGTAYKMLLKNQKNGGILYA